MMILTINHSQYHHHTILGAVTQHRHAQGIKHSNMISDSIGVVMFPSVVEDKLF